MQRRALLASALATPALATPTLAQGTERVRVAVFDVTSALPFYVARERGMFARQGIEITTIPLQTHPLIVQALVANEADACSNLVTLEAANINQRRANSVIYFALNGQNEQFRMEQFVVRPSSTARTLADLRGARIASAPGPANMAAARGVLASVGLGPNDYTLMEQPMGVHIGGVQSGQFDAAYTLEPVGTVGQRAGAFRLLEAGVISTHLLGRKDAKAFAAGAGFSGRYLAEKPAVAARFAAAWAEALSAIRTDPTTLSYLTSHLNTPADLAASVPLLAYTMVKDMTPQDRQDLQRFIDIAVQQGVLRGAIDASTFIRPL